MINKQSIILIVDDDEANRTVLHNAILSMGHIPLLAENGQSALSMIKQQQPDLILLDLIMPVMDGYETLSYLKSDKTYKNIAVLLISAKGDQDSIVKGIEHGADDYLTKPYNPAILKARISSFLEKKHLHDSEIIHAEQIKILSEDLQKRVDGQVQEITKGTTATTIATRKAEQSASELQTLIDTANAPIFGIDTEGNINEWNQAAEKLTHYIKDEVYGRDLVEEYITEEYKDSVKDVLQDALQGKETSNYEFPLYSKEGSRRMILLNATPRRDIDGNITGVIGIGQDITQIDISRKELVKERESLEVKVKERTDELHKSLQKLKDTNLYLESINRHKSEFISSMSHELRTPLNGIIGSADLLHEQFFGALNPKQLSYAKLITKSADHLLSLINDLLDMAKIDAGTMELQPRKMSLAEWMESTVEIMKTEFRKKDIKVRTRIESSYAYITADHRKCNQIMLNLLSNALKYTPEGHDISIRISDENSEYIRVEVEDSGIGIETKDFERIFSEFYQVDRRRDEKLGGTGIGLALTKRLIEMHGGEIWVESAKSGGALLIFTLPIEQKKSIHDEIEHDTPEKDGLSFDTSKQKKILIAEDNPTNASLILDMLSTFKNQTVVVENGKMALDMLQSFKPDLVLMDVKMPVMDGLEATQKIREMPEFADLPIIAITASVTEESKKIQIEKGYSDHLPKPIKHSELIQVVSKYLNNNI